MADGSQCADDHRRFRSCGCPTAGSLPSYAHRRRWATGYDARERDAGGRRDAGVSARHLGVQTETLVRAWHTEIHSHPETLQALLYILSVHYADYQAAVGR
jgi:hypothetical protein